MITHMGIQENGKWKYLCNQVVNANKNKITDVESFVTCKNCLRHLEEGVEKK